ncbi:MULTISPECIES: hypothetical protein [Thermomonospora]|uniref:DUF4232 domain-containing protein n=1 Tax=Thermomonospora curvata (strain ATCC 19995 / DSM 43183 / JCM 3096 / KCTC 9072 / NBRC 15933 / NCIMB 10081 / Henssen B9) TaxID=471852 RepID=D1AAA0_THECD|nr:MULTISPECIES: hypothetical protein [Thermomonospora]ACY98813.1 hypothetical protein Tcur_3274 [Thermomonospora curvata DSM 43183]PKK13023.1 MAG: hypothetical protein BUE48_016055 [Thermomonospora sp. CIF 1]
MSNSYRSQRRRKQRNAGKVGLAGALTGALGIGAVVAGYVALKPDAEPSSPPAIGAQESTQGGGAVTDAPRTGPTLNVTTPEGYGYGLGAARAGTDDSPLPGSTPLPKGTTYAYAEYVLTNTQQRPILLDFPADLFLPLKYVPSSARKRCMPQPGVPEDMCTLPNRSRITARLNGSPGLIADGADKLMPPGSSYLVRIATELPVSARIDPADIRLYVWNARFTSDRKGIEVQMPERDSESRAGR